MSFHRDGHPANVNGALLLLLIPVALGALSAILVLTAYAERHILSPRSLIPRAALARHSEPEYAEALVAREFERLLRDSQRD